MYEDIASSLVEPFAVCTAATYTLLPNSTVGVFNEDREFSPDGPVSTIRGWAAQDDPSAGDGRLTVHLQGVPVAAPYWVVAIGPQDGPDMKYEWAVVSDEFKVSLFVLARNATKFAEQYNETVYSLLINEGFNGPLNSPIATNQTGC
jgi:apolipoprotein D and lipocalin family protein